jgi:hypothetical protein
MRRLLVVHHTPSPAVQEMFEAAVSGARTDEIEGIEVVIRPALTAAAADVLQADGYLLGTPAAIALGTRLGTKTLSIPVYRETGPARSGGQARNRADAERAARRPPASPVANP